MSDLCSRYLHEHAREHKKASSANLDERNIENHVRPLLGDFYVDEISRADVDRFKRAIKEGASRKPGHHRRTSFRGGNVVTGGAVVANRCLSLLSKMFNLAETWGWRQEGSNPVRHIEKYKEERRERFLSADEFASLGEALSNASIEEAESPFAIAALRLLILTGARLSEILTLRWENVDVGHSCLKLSDSKTGAKTVWLNPPALEILTSIPRIRDNPFVIVGGRARTNLVNIRKPWSRICKRAGLSGLRIHDLRHSYASVAVGAGVGLYLTGKLLGHLRNSTTERYAHLADDPVRQANALVGRRLAEALDRNSTIPKAPEAGVLAASRRPRIS